MAFSVSKNRSRIDLAFSATLENVDRAAEAAKQFLLVNGLEKHAFAILLGLREALNNAVLKGAGQRPDATVRCRVRHRPDRVVLEVEDQGKGFQWRRHLGKSIPALMESGRGILILERYFETIWFNEKGNRLILVKLL